VAILGFGSTVRECPWRDPSWELWGLNGFWRAAKADFGIEAPEERFSLWFDLHSLDYTRKYGAVAGFGDAQERWLERSHPFPIFMLEAVPQFPSVLRFPVEEVVARVGREYFTSTIAYALAYALSLPDVAEIGLWGVDLVDKTEYQEQRPCAEYWIGRAEAVGIRVTIHQDSALLRQLWRYGYERTDPLLEQLDQELGRQETGLVQAIERSNAEEARWRAQAHTDDGALQTVRALRSRLEVYRRGGRI
jgi:hypothetical protein